MEKKVNHSRQKEKKDDIFANIPDNLLIQPVIKGRRIGFTEFFVKNHARTLDTNRR